jgi:hypothetical protein
VATGFTDGTTHWIRVTFDQDNGSSQSEVNFYTAADSSTIPTVWTPLGTAQTSADTGNGRASVQSVFFASGYVSNLGDRGLNGTLRRAIVNDGIGGTTVLDADFEAQTENAIAFTESSSNAATITVTTNRYSYGLPNVEWNASNVVQALTANTVFYQPFVVSAPITVDATNFAVSTGPASAANVRTGVYLADSNLQPSGAPLIDSGNVAVGTSVTGTFLNQFTPVTLQPGVYLTAINTSVNLTCRVQRGGPTGTNVGNGTSSLISLLPVSQTQGAFPNPGTAWTTPTYAATGPNHVLFLRWSPA